MINIINSISITKHFKIADMVNVMLRILYCNEKKKNTNPQHDNTMWTVAESLSGRENKQSI